jgi:hypothetical protein
MRDTRGRRAGRREAQSGRAGAKRACRHAAGGRGAGVPAADRGRWQVAGGRWAEHPSSPVGQRGVSSRARRSSRGGARRTRDHGGMRGFSGFDAWISGQGGVVSRRELLEAGWTADELRFGIEYGRLVRLRRGWYSSHDLPAPVRSSWALGGPLACVSALVHHGAIPGDDPRVDSATVHVSLPAHAKRPRTIGPAGVALSVVHHWWGIQRGPGDRHAVPVETALLQLDRCLTAATSLAAAAAAAAATTEVTGGAALSRARCGSSRRGERP